MRILQALVSIAVCLVAVTGNINAKPRNSSAAIATSKCPYDFTTTSRMIPKWCYPNYTDSSANSGRTTCCWYVYAAYLYSIIEYANKTGVVYLDSNHSKRCTNEFSRYVKNGGLVRSSFFRNNSRCILNPYDFTARAGPCRYGTLQEIWNAVDLRQSTKECTGRWVTLTDPNKMPDNECNRCQVAIGNSTFQLLGLTKSKDFIACGMASTVGVWGRIPSVPAFTGYFLCAVEVLGNVGDLHTVFPDPKSPEPKPARNNSGGDNIKRSPSSKAQSRVAATVGVAVAVALLALLLLYTFKTGKLRKYFASGDAMTWTEGTQGALEMTSKGRAKLSIRETLPTEGLYIFTRRELKRATENFDAGRVLGEGGSGKVYLGRLPSGKQVAIKRIVQKKKLDQFYQEVELLSKLRHPNLTSLLGYCLHRNEHILVYEYMPGGDLAHLLYERDPTGCPFTWLQRLRIGLDCAEGLVYLHEFPEGAIIHRDIKPTNILLNEDGQAKLSDFGVSKIIAANFSHVSTEIKGTTGYLDPEYFSLGHLTEASDVYSFGIVLLELVSGRKAIVNTPSGGADSIVYSTHMLMRTENPDLRKLIDPRIEAIDAQFESMKMILNLAYRCVQPYRSERPSMLEVTAVLRKSWAMVMSIPDDHLCDSHSNMKAVDDSTYIAGALSYKPVMDDPNFEVMKPIAYRRKL